MDQTYLSTNFTEIQSDKRFVSGGSSENLEDFYHYFTSSDESFNSNSSSNSNDKSYKKKNDVLKSHDLLLNDDESRSNCVNFNDVDNINENTLRKESCKSFRSLVKYVKKLTLKTEKLNHSQQQSILRKPTEYTYVKGMSGLAYRVAKPSLRTHQRCVSKD